MVPVSSGRFPRDLWLRYILPMCDALSLLKLEKTSKFFYFNINYMSCKSCDYSDFQPKFLTSDQLETKFIRSLSCTSLWTRYATQTKFTHAKYGRDLQCRITKFLMARELLKIMLPTVLAKMWKVGCSENKHGWKKDKKSFFCVICSKSG